ncbi:tetratricopeptide repeat protein, partial [Streptomyces anulatus]
MKQPPEDSLQFLFHIHGPAGVGKSTLVRQLETAARETGAFTSYVDESVADVVETMEAVSLQLAQQGAPLKSFDKLLATYRQRRHEADAAAAETASAGAEAARLDQALAGPDPSPSSMIVSQIGLVGLGMIPGVGALTGAVDPTQVAAGADRMKAILSTRLRSHDDVQLVLSPVQTLTPVFLEDLADAAKRRQWLVLFFDTYERTGQLLDTWLRNILVSDRFGELPANVLVVLAGQRPMDTHCWGDWLDLVTDLPLEVFTETEARQFLATKGVTDDRVIEVILHLSGQLPVLVSTLAEARPTSAADVGDPSGTAVERFLKWETDPAHRAAALACALPQELNEDIFRAAVEGEATSELFNWLRSMPFVTDRVGRFHYHEVVRTSMLRLQRQQSPMRWQEQHTRLANAFQQRRAQLEIATGSEGEQWDDEHWRGYRLQETYHRLCADPRQALSRVLRELVDAYGHRAVTLRRWVQTLTRASEDSADPTMIRWAKDLTSALDNSHPGVAAMSLILARGRLDIPGRHLAHTLRGRDYRNTKQYEQAITEYNTALALEPDGVRAVYGRGMTLNLMRAFDEALADLTRAIELDPAHKLAFARRGLTYRDMGKFDEALADFTRAIELDPASTWPLTSRGLTYRDMGKFDEALADFTRAIELDPTSTWPLTSRGLTYRDMGKFDEALADFTRAIELD